MSKKKIAVFSGAGISRESGIDTFRDIKDGLWYNYNVDDVATIEGWRRNPQIVMEFHNMLRSGLDEKEPNSAHKALKDLEDKFEVTIITQNVDNLHEKAGSTNVLHLHGELFKSRAVNDDAAIELFDCRGDLNLGDTDEEGNQLRPHTVFFGEMPYNVDESYKAVRTCDILIVIGTSLPILYTHHMLGSVNPNATIYYIDPKPAQELEYMGLDVNYIAKTATEGMAELMEIIKVGHEDS